MHGVLRRWRGLALAGLFVTSGCGLLDPDAIEVSLSLSNSEIAPDSTIRIEIRTANRGSTPIHIGVQGCPREFEILDGGGAVVGPGPMLCTLALVAPLTLEPGQSHTTIHEWSGEGSDDDWTRLPDGEYRVRAWVDVTSEGRVYADTKKVRVEGASNP